MEPELIEKIEKAIAKAEDKLRSARRLTEIEAYDDAISRAYYAIFHAASALLMLKGLEPRTHSGLVTLFGLHFVKSGAFEERFGRILSEAKELRENGDYEIFFSASVEDAESSMENASEFLKAAKDYVDNWRKNWEGRRQGPGAGGRRA